jgi:hypothetical protein
MVVHDTGPGIDPSLLPVVFERFSRGDGAGTRASGGAGLGLSLVQVIVGAHSGSVEVRSTRGNTEFTVTLPAAPPRRPDGRRAASAVGGHTSRRSSGGRRSWALPLRYSVAGRPGPRCTTRSVGTTKSSVRVTLRWKLPGSRSPPHITS